jgi:hypothetical protein
MVLTGLVLAKSILVGVGVSAAIGAGAVATGQMHGLEIAIANVSGHAKTVLENLMNGSNPSGR